MLFFSLLLCSLSVIQATPNIDVHNLTNQHFSDPYHVPTQNPDYVYVFGTTQQYLKCQKPLNGVCSAVDLQWSITDALQKQSDDAKINICGIAAIHPLQSGDGSWDALVTLHVQKGKCDGITGWSVIVHASPGKDSSNPGTDPPDQWIGDKILVGNFYDNVDANYDGKYFRSADGQLFLIYQKENSTDPHRDGIVAQPMSNPTTLTGSINWLLLPSNNLGSEDFVAGIETFKLVETGNIRVINGTYIMAYSTGSYVRNTYKVGIAYSNSINGNWRKVMHENPDKLWNTNGPEVYYLLQSQENHDGWRYIGGQVLAPGVPTVIQISGDWFLLFAGYNPQDAPSKDGGSTYDASHRRPYFIKLNVQIPSGANVQTVSDSELQSWITPA